MPNQKQTAYEKLKDSYIQFKLYQNVLDNLQKGIHDETVQQSPQIAQQAVLDSELTDAEKQDQLERLQGVPNTFAIYPWIKYGAEKKRREFGEHAKDNLEAILRSAPTENLIKALPYFNPKEKSETSDYKGISELHRKVNEMNANLAMLQSRDVSEENKKVILKRVNVEVLDYYKSKYGDNRLLLNAIQSTILYTEGTSIPIYSRLLKEKTEELKDQLKTRSDLVAYISKALEEKDIVRFYETILNINDENYEE